jgi:hypothetical protein
MLEEPYLDLQQHLTLFEGELHHEGRCMDFICGVIELNESIDEDQLLLSVEEQVLCQHLDPPLGIDELDTFRTRDVTKVAAREDNLVGIQFNRTACNPGSPS